MSVIDAEKQREDDAQNNIVAGVRGYLAALPEKDGLDRAIHEGEQIAAIIEPLRLPANIVAAVHAYPLFREKILKLNDLENNKLSAEQILARLLQYLWGTVSQ